MVEKPEPNPNSLSAEEANYLDIEPEERMDYVNTAQGRDEEKGEEEEVRFEEEVPGEDVTDEMLLEDVNRGDTWLSYNKGLEQTGFAPTELLSGDNVETLSREYVLETDAQGMQVNPTIVPGDPPVMYFSGADRFVRAVNARTGEPYWEYRIPWFRPEQQDIYWVLEQGRDRGVTVWGDKVYFGTTDGYIVALNRYTGEREFIGDIRWDENLPDELAEYPQIWTGVSAAPVVYDGKVFTGFRTDQVLWSSAQALDAETGDIVWRSANTPPSEWVEDGWAFGNSTTWMNPTIDPESETVFFNSGDPSSFYNSLHRPGPNKHSASIRAFDFDGENKWNHQLLAHEMWDYDACSTPSVVDATVNGEEHRVLLEDTKDGWVHMIDVETGRLLQRSAPFGKQEHRFGDWPDSEYLNLVPFGEENAGTMFPRASGASEWPPDAYSPRTNMRYVGAMDAGSNVWAEGFFLDMVEYGDPDNPYVGGGSEAYEDHDNVARVAAIDVDTGEMAWEYEFEDVDPEMPSPWPGGPTATAGGIVFGPSSGGNLVALDDETGDQLWVDDTEARITASPVVWDDPEDDRAFVAVASNDRIVTYSTEE